MNTSLSTVDSVFNTGGHVERANSRRLASHSLRQQAEASCTSMLDEINLEKLRCYSPSFNDSEPPSYFDVIGRCNSSQQQTATAAHGDEGITPRTLSTTSTQLTVEAATAAATAAATTTTLPKVVLSSSRLASYGHGGKEANMTTTGQSGAVPPPNHRRMPVIRTHNLPMSVNQAAVCYSSSDLRCAGGHSRLGGSMARKPCETYVVWSVLTTLYCIFVGLPALVFSIKVHHYNKHGNYQKAFSRSRIAKYLNITGLFFGCIYVAAVVVACLLPRR